MFKDNNNTGSVGVFVRHNAQIAENGNRVTHCGGPRNGGIMKKNRVPSPYARPLRPS